MSNSLKKNYLLNLINTVTGIVFPLITFPYASRVLQAEGIGVINFYNSILSYITLVTCLGIPLYATREIAKVKHSPEQLSRTSTEILFLHLLLTLAGYLVVLTLCLTVDKIREHLLIFAVMSSSIFFTTMGCEWFYRGTEDFKYITIRGLCIRLIYIPLLFIFVRTADDLLAYGILTVMVAVGNNVFNFYRLSKKVRLSDMRYAASRPFRHLKGALKIFALTAAISLYTQMNIVILGFLSSTTAVGYYVGATRITTIVAGIVTALQTSLLPRVSTLLAQEDRTRYEKTVARVLNFIYCFALPLAVGLVVLAGPMIRLVCGPSYQPAVTTLAIIAPNLVVIALSGFISGGILLPHGKENIATVACLIGAVVNIILNLSLIPHFAQNGTAVASVATELAVLVGMICLGKAIIPIRLWQPRYFLYPCGAAVMGVVCWWVATHISNDFISLIAVPAAGAAIYISFLFIARDPLALEVAGIVKRKLHL